MEIIGNRRKNYFFALKKLKKPPQKVAYLSKNSVVSEIFLLLQTAQMWPIEQLYIELGLEHFCDSS